MGNPTDSQPCEICGTWVLKCNPLFWPDCELASAAALKPDCQNECPLSKRVGLSQVEVLGRIGPFICNIRIEDLRNSQNRLTKLPQHVRNKCDANYLAAPFEAILLAIPARRRRFAAPYFSATNLIRWIRRLELARGRDILVIMSSVSPRPK